MRDSRIRFLAAVAGVGLGVLLGRALGEASAPARANAIGGDRADDEPIAASHLRGLEAGRGRRARKPWEIPWSGWKDILWRTYGQIDEDRVLAIAAGVVFYGLLAIFPAITALVSLYGLVADVSTVSEHLRLLSGILPANSYTIVEEQVTRLTAPGNSGLTFGFVFGLGLAIWSANAGMKAVIDALNVVYDETEKRGFIKLNLVSLAFTLGALILVLAAISAVVALPLVLSFTASREAAPLLAVLRWPAVLVVLLLALAVLYRFAPSREEPKWQWLTVGSASAALAWIVGSAALSFYLANFADYNATYGSLGAAIALMTWMWMSAIVVLLGAELNSEIEHQTSQDTTTGGQRPMGTRGAVMADTVGASAA